MTKCNNETCEYEVSHNVTLPNLFVIQMCENHAEWYKDVYGGIRITKINDPFSSVLYPDMGEAYDVNTHKRTYGSI